MANTHRGGGALYGADPHRTREGLSARAVANSDEIQLRIDPMHADLEEEITGIHKKVIWLKSVAQEIESEAKFQKDLLSQLVVVFGLVCFSLVYLWTKCFKR